MLKLVVLHVTSRLENGKERSRNHICRRKALNITYLEYASIALGIQHAMRMRLFILASVIHLAVPCFSTLSIK